MKRFSVIVALLTTMLSCLNGMPSALGKIVSGKNFKQPWTSQDFFHPMTFSIITMRGHYFPFSPDYNSLVPFSGPKGRKYEVVVAQGEITPGTAERLRQFLDTKFQPVEVIILESPGGDLDEGMRLGELIRQKNLDTMVGHVIDLNVLEEPGLFEGYCLSSCTFAFLGGVHRAIENSGYGLHRFFANADLRADLALDLAQIKSAQILQYVTKMGAKPELIVEMTKAGSEELNLLDRQQLLDLHVVTHQGFSDPVDR
jgi:hypothetical protein